MVDVGLSQAIVRWLNRGYRKRAKPHGKLDHYYRGVRMTRTLSSRLFFLFCWLMLLVGAVAVFFVPNIFEHEPWYKVWFVRAGWLVVAGIVLFTPWAMALDFAVVTDDGLLRPKVFGGVETMAWSEMTFVRVDGDSNEVAFIAGDRRKCKINLAYDGWRDLMEMASRRMNPNLFYQLIVLVQNVDVRRPRPQKKKAVATDLHR